MKKIDKTILRETYFIGAWVLILSALMQSVFLIIGKWDYTVLLGNLLSAMCGILNFLFLGMTVQRAIASKDEKYVKNLMRLSQALRLLLVLCVAVLGATIPIFNLWATLIPLFFTRIAITIRPFFNNKMGTEANMNLSAIADEGKEEEDEQS
ncbi:MAG: hypothetical protein E7622_03425 [Ruminococcaceae bacterium]|nr:hypothetical protein [Oscillospiraceae bacterium]